MAGLLGLSDDPQTLGLLSLGLRLMSNPSRRFGAALGQSGLGAIGDVQQAQAAQERRRAQALQEQLVRQQIEQGNLGLDAARREAELSRLPEQFIRPPMVAGADGTDAGAGMGGGQMDAGKMDLMGLRQAYLGKGALRRAAEVEAFIPKPREPEYKVVGDNLVRIDPTRQTVSEAYRAPAKPGSSSPLAQLMSEYAALPPDSPMRQVYLDAIKKATTHAPAATMNNFGSPQAGIDSSTGLPVFVVTDKTGTGKVLPGVRPPKSSTEERTEQERKERERQGQQMLSVMGQARKILQEGDPTGSGVGAAVDAAGRAVGVSTPGAQTAAQLEALSGWLVANVPRMEGPQSNMDVENYKTMAGKIGMRNVPVSERLAALKVVEELQRKYASINGGAAPAVRRYNPATGKIE